MGRRSAERRIRRLPPARQWQRTATSPGRGVTAPLSPLWIAWATSSSGPSRYPPSSSDSGYWGMNEHLSPIGRRIKYFGGLVRLERKDDPSPVGGPDRCHGVVM